MTLSANNAFNYLRAQGACASVAANTPASVNPVGNDLGSVQRVGGGVVYFAGLQQVPDPSIANTASATIRPENHAGRHRRFR